MSALAHDPRPTGKRSEDGELGGLGAANARAARVLASALAGLPVVISPGSRSSALALAFDQLPGARALVVLDERAAGFTALGLARGSGQPAVLVCTSGSAPGHYLPAIMEADRGRVPLIVITADRPPELHHCGAAQTTQQSGMFGSYLRWAADLPVPAPERGCEGWLTAMATRARAAALGSPAGPVQLNVPFRKPLYHPDDAAAPCPRAVRLLSGTPALHAQEVASLAGELAAESRGAIVCGPLASAATDPAAFGEAARVLGARLGWPILADAASGLGWLGPSAGVVRAGDALARSGVLPRADVVLRIGAPPTSQALSDWLAACPRSLLVDPDGWYLDPAARADTLIAADPVRLCRALAEAIDAGDGPGALSPSWLAHWMELDRRAAQAIAEAIAGEGSDFGGAIARAVAAAMPPRSRLHVASSMPIRDLDSFAAAGAAHAGGSELVVTANRGLNGIDGSIATAMGVSLAAGGAPTALLVGDLAFVHDIGGLLAACAAGVRLSVVVCDNGGGAIFEALPVAEQIDRARFERLFATPQGHDIGALCRAAGARHRRVAAPEIGAALADDLERSGVGVIEVEIDRARENALRAQVWRQIGRALQRRDNPQRSMEEP